MKKKKSKRFIIKVAMWSPTWVNEKPKPESFVEAVAEIK